MMVVPLGLRCRERCVKPEYGRTQDDQVARRQRVMLESEYVQMPAHPPLSLVLSRVD